MLKPSPNPLDRLLAVAHAARASDPDGAVWLEEIAERHVATGESLDRLTGTSGQLGRSPRFQVLRRRRDQSLARALDDLAGNFASLAREIEYFETRIPRPQREAPTPDPKWPAYRAAIHQAARTGLALPRTRDGLRRALSGADES